jgi:hypothetical protein
VSGSAEILVTNRSIYHGFIADDHAPVVQPEFELFGQFYEGDGFLTSARSPSACRSPLDWATSTTSAAGTLASFRLA